jgi:hypothetical protein
MYRRLIVVVLAVVALAGGAFLHYSCPTGSLDKAMWKRIEFGMTSQTVARLMGIGFTPIQLASKAPVKEIAAWGQLEPPISFPERNRDGTMVFLGIHEGEYKGRRITWEDKRYRIEVAFGADDTVAGTVLYEFVETGWFKRMMKALFG